MTDHLLRAPATLRNREPILEILRSVLPKSGVVLEIASGSGEHLVYFAEKLPGLVFQPSDRNPAALLSISALVEATGVTNVCHPLALDACSSWPIAFADAIICINMIHIAPWRATVGLMSGASAALDAGAPLYLYGPYRRKGVHTSPSNEEFDRSLRMSDQSWGVRDLEEVATQGRVAGFSEPAVTEMPANNLSVVFRRM